jgi:hypothetical protein
MVYIDIPYVPENDRINKDLVKKELQMLNISDEAKLKIYNAIYNLKPRGVSFGDNTKEANTLQSILGRLSIPYRQTEDSEFNK